MKKKLAQIRTEGYKTLAAIFIIGIAVYLGFTPLFDRVSGGVAGAVLGASFGAIFVIVLTMYLLNKQTEIEQESKKSERIFEQKIKLYDDLLEHTEEMLRDGKITKEVEMQKIPFVLIRLQMLGSDEAIEAYIPIYKEINILFNNKPGEDEVEITELARERILSALSEFSGKCRVDLGVQDVEVKEDLFKETKSIIKSADLIRRGKTVYMEGGIEAFLKECKEKGRPPELIESTKKLHDELKKRYGQDPEFRIDFPDFTKTQSAHRLPMYSRKGVFCYIILRTKYISINGIFKSPRWKYKQLKDGELYFEHWEKIPKLKLDGITQIDDQNLKKILVVLDESKKVLEEGTGLDDYKKLAKKGDEEARRQLKKHTDPDYTLELNLDNE